MEEWSKKHIIEVNPANSANGEKPGFKTLEEEEWAYLCDFELPGFQYINTVSRCTFFDKNSISGVMDDSLNTLDYFIKLILVEAVKKVIAQYCLQLIKNSNVTNLTVNSQVTNPVIIRRKRHNTDLYFIYCM